ATSDPVEQIRVELRDEEKAGFEGMWKSLGTEQRGVLSDFTSRLPVGVRGTFTAALLAAAEGKRRGTVGYLAAGGAIGRKELASAHGEGSPDQWNGLIDLWGNYPEVMSRPHAVSVSHGFAPPRFAVPWQAEIYKSGESAAPLTPLEARTEREQYGTRLA